MSQDERRLFPVRRDRGALDEQTPARVAVAESARRAMIPREFASRVLGALLILCRRVNRRTMIFREFPRQVLGALDLCQRVDRTLGRWAQRFGVMTAAAMIT